MNKFLVSIISLTSVMVLAMGLYVNELAQAKQTQVTNQRTIKLLAQSYRK